MQKLQNKKWKQSFGGKFKILNDLRSSGGRCNFCDIKLITKDKVEINAHRNILYTGSGYFREFFSMKNATAEQVELNEVNSAVLEKVITFIYCGEIEVSKAEEVEDIAHCANFLEIDELVDECMLLLAENVSDSNCLKYWKLAEEFSSETLEKQCISHIFQSARELYKNESFLNSLSKDEMKKLITSHEILNSDHEHDLPPIGETKESDLSSFLDLLGPKEYLPTKKLYMISGKKVITIDPNDGNATAVQTKNNDVRNFGFTTVNNVFLRYGGRIYRGEKLTKTCAYYNPDTKEWNYFPPMEMARVSLACAYLDNKIYACGGGSVLASFPQACPNVEIFDLEKEKWIYGLDMKKNRRDFGLIPLNQSLYAVGGSDDFKFNVEQFDPRMPDGWTEIYSAETGGHNWHCKCISIGTDIYCFRYTYFSSVMDSFIFDTKMNMVRSKDWIGESYNVYNGAFGVCELDGCINLLIKTDDDYLDFYKYNTKGNLLLLKNEMFYLSHKGNIDALFSLYTQN